MKKERWREREREMKKRKIKNCRQAMLCVGKENMEKDGLREKELIKKLKRVKKKYRNGGKSMERIEEIKVGIIKERREGNRTGKERREENWTGKGKTEKRRKLDGERKDGKETGRGKKRRKGNWTGKGKTGKGRKLDGERKDGKGNEAGRG